MTNFIARRSVLTAIGATLLPAARGTAFAQSAIGAPTTIVVPSSPGGAADILARLVASKLAGIWGQPVIAENKPGAEQQIGASLVARSAPDGRTLLLAAPSFTASNKYFSKSLPYNQAMDFVSVAQLVSAPGVLAVAADLPARNVQELAALLRPGSGRYNYAYGASAGRIYGRMFNDAVNANKVTFVGYRGSLQGMMALASGEAHYMWDAYATARLLVESGKIRIIAVCADTRMKELPDVPTLAEQGYPDVNISAWWGLMAPKGTPPDVVARINRAVNSVLEMPDVRESFVKYGMTAAQRTPQQFDAMYKAELERFEAVSKKLVEMSPG